jgi:hypothetical protein
LLDLPSVIRIPLAIISGVLLFALLDRMFHLTEGAFHHLFGGGILWTYLLVPTLVAFLVGYWIGPWGKFLAAIPPMTYVLVAYLIASRHADYHSLGIPTAPFMMIFFITVPEVSFSGGWAGEVLRKKRDLRRRREARQRESMSQNAPSTSERGIKS